MSKLSEMMQHLFRERDFTWQFPTEKQHELHQKAIALSGSRLSDYTYFVGMVQGYHILLKPSPDGNSQDYVAVKIWKSGFFTEPVYFNSYEQAPYVICRKIAWGALSRRANVGVWQLQLPAHLSPLRPHYEQSTSE